MENRLAEYSVNTVAEVGVAINAHIIRRLLEKGILDSLAIVKLLSFLEEEFDIEIDDADFDPDNFESIRSIANLATQ